MSKAVAVINNAIETASRDLAAAKTTRLKAEAALTDAEAAEAQAEEFLADLIAAAERLSPEDDGPVIEPTPEPEPVDPEPEPVDPEPEPVDPEPEPVDPEPEPVDPEPTDEEGAGE